jgi:uncharacterized protein YxeA
MKKLIGIIAMIALISMIAGSVIAHSYDITTKNVYTDAKKYNDVKVYKVSKDCSKVTLNKNTWKNRSIVSKKNYVDPRSPHQKYCGIIYKFK